MRVLHYVHHHGSGHLHRALALAGPLVAGGAEVTLASSAAPPAGPSGGLPHGVRWLALPFDHDPLADSPPLDARANDRLHWAPLGHAGLRQRTALLSAWIERHRPDVAVCDVSQEVALLCRLHGVPVVSVVLPGRRDDPAHRLGLGVSAALIGCWPASATVMSPGLPAELADRLEPIGAVSRYPPASPRPGRRPGRRVVVLGGRGGDGWSASEVDRLRETAEDAGWLVRVLGPGGEWVADPWPVLRHADVVVLQAGQNAVAEVAAARVPAIVVAASRPFDEQATTAAQLDAGPWPAVALPGLAADDWPALLAEVARLDGGAWATWCDGRAAERFADAVRGVATPLGRGSEREVTPA